MTGKEQFFKVSTQKVPYGEANFHRRGLLLSANYCRSILSGIQAMCRKGEIMPQKKAAPDISVPSG